MTKPTLIFYIDRPLSIADAELLPAGAEVRVVGTSRVRADLQDIPRLLVRDSPDLVVGTTNYLPPRLTQGLPSVVTIHDAMGIKHYPWDKVARTPRERFVNRYWAWLTRRSAARARRVLTVSHGARAELLSTLHLPEGRVCVVYNGVIVSFLNPPPARDENSVLVIESPDPRKNAQTAYAALRNVASDLHRPLRLRIVCNGERAVERVRARHALLDAPGLCVETITGVTDAGLHELYARSRVFVWPSRFEGFGLPPVEAMQNGCAVVSSSAPAMPEILGDVPLYAASDGIDAFASHIAVLLSDVGECEARSIAGRALAAKFTCRRMADETVAVWDEALAS